MILQKDRVYSLIVGNENGAVEINNLQIRFQVVKTSNNKDKKNSAHVEIFNLKEETRKAFEEDYVRVSLKVGYYHTELVELFAGEVVNISNTKSNIKPFNTRRRSTDLITKLDIDELYSDMNNRVVSHIVPAGQTVGDAISAIVRDIPSVTRQQMNGTAITRQLVDGYPLIGTPRQSLDKISKEYGINWQIDNGVLYVSDHDGTFTDNRNSVPKIGQLSGLIERPEYTNPDRKRLKKKDKKNKSENTLKFKILLNPTIVAGSIIYLDFENISGYYKVDEVRHEGDFRSDKWESTIICSERI